AVRGVTRGECLSSVPEVLAALELVRPLAVRSRLEGDDDDRRMNEGRGGEQPSLPRAVVVRESPEEIEGSRRRNQHLGRAEVGNVAARAQASHGKREVLDDVVVGRDE